MVVCCRFPEEERPGEPGSKVRPVVITRVRKGNHLRAPVVEVMFGTSVLAHVRDPNIQISRDDELKQTGLRQPTKFLLRKRAAIPATGRFFIRNGNGDIAIGMLPIRAVEKMNNFLAYETEDQRVRAQRFGRRPMELTWTPSSEQNKELTHA
jgi:hypothetical protein